MAKGTFYFSHDYNARNDDKIKRMIRSHGMTGYGIFWAIIEDLYQNENSMKLDCEGIAFDLHTNEEIVESIIHDFDLFIICDDIFSSLSIQKRMEEREERSEKMAGNARKRWENMQLHSKPDAIALQTECKGNALKESKVKDIKGKESKGKEKGAGAGLFSENPFSGNEQFVNAWTAWEVYRVEKRQKLTDSTRTKQLKFLSKFPVSTAIEILEKSITNGWTGLFEPKNQKNEINQRTFIRPIARDAVDQGSFGHL